MNITKRQWLLAASFCLLSSPVFANENPQGLATDSRIKIVAYNQDDVVTLIGNHLISTGIELQPTETILSIVNGDPIAWTTTVNKVTPYILYVNPVLPSSSTNMIVITDKHRYQFHLITRPSDSANSREVTYLIQFKYPDEEKAALSQELLTLQQTFVGNVPGNPVTWNYNYSFYGDKDIAPIQAVDNGTFTIFKFSQTTPLPAIFAVDSHQHESLVNFRVQGNFIFIQGTGRQFTLRNGENVTTVYNDSFKPY